MSMFHELMMRKKEEIMYATIKGTLTENDGVFSGFSASNYLITQQTFPNNPNSFEAVIKFNTTSLSTNQTLFSGRTTLGPFQLSLRSTGKLRFYFGSNNSDCNNVYSVDTDYYVKILYRLGTGVTISYSTDGTNWLLDKGPMAQFTIPVADRLLSIGINYAGTNNEPFVGTIDLNKTYLKIDGTKYNLQAVVGYTIVGSPTIVDGVVSGFSSANYLTCLGADAISSADNWEIVLRLINGSGSYFIGSNKSYALTISRSSGNIFLSSNGSSWDIANAVGLGVALPTDCYIKLKFTGTKYICEYSTDNINWVSVANIESSLKLSTITYLKIGSWTGSSNYSGSIDLNNSYIKVNGKLWFNGQQA